MKSFFQILSNFDPVKEILKIIQCHLYFNEQGDYSEKNTSDNEVF